ncbi:DUF7606 domain-containing protein [Neisseria lisongii]|uniref:Adhesin n=1 Tax=Neisseria lisongii TaxID=2912188 RepID=A0AAW5ANZ0_9NEIS|nr:adhesin [Neisseria lisongii]MCF7528760.1 adhesin [Neisseria lisongii]MCF7529618.1 adhesin [Neisseria lisongii]
MKLLSAIVLSSLIAVSGTAAAAQKTANTKSVQYSCQQGKKVKVTYAFNKQGLPTYASAYVNGKVRTMPINLNHSNSVDTIFGQEDSYMLNSNYLDSKNYRKSSIMITAPDNQIVYKGCSARG